MREWGPTAIYTLAKAGIVQGYDDGTFRPDNPVLRAQLAKMLVGALGLEVRDGAISSTFVDVPTGPPSDPLYPDDYVAVAAANGIVQGFSSSLFGPYQPVTRIQMVSMVVRALERLRPGRLEKPTPGWEFQYVEATDLTHGANVRLAEYNGLLTWWFPWDDSLYEPATREEMAVMLYSALGGELAPLWPLGKSTVSLAELETELRDLLPPDLLVYLPRELPAGWAIAASPLPWAACSPSDGANPYIDPEAGSCRIVFTDGTTTVRMDWPIEGDYGDGFTGFHNDGITYYEGNVCKELYHSSFGWVMLWSDTWGADALRAIADSVQRVR